MQAAAPEKEIIIIEGPLYQCLSEGWTNGLSINLIDVILPPVSAVLSLTLLSCLHCL